MLTLLRLPSSQSRPVARSVFVHSRNLGYSFSNNTASQPDLTRQIYVSNSTDPYFNLALEDWFVGILLCCSSNAQFVGITFLGCSEMLRELNRYFSFIATSHVLS
jgi:hypothetical protein